MISTKLELRYMGYKLDDTLEDKESQMTLVFRDDSGGKFTLRGAASEIENVKSQLRLFRKGLPVSFEIKQLQKTLEEPAT